MIRSILKLKHKVWGCSLVGLSMGLNRGKEFQISRQISRKSLGNMLSFPSQISALLKNTAKRVS
jgi:hypothetical protein